MLRKAKAVYEGRLIITKFRAGSLQGELHFSEKLRAPAMHDLLEQAADSVYEESAGVPLLLGEVRGGELWFDCLVATLAISRKVVEDE